MMRNVSLRLGFQINLALSFMAVACPSKTGYNGGCTFVLPVMCKMHKSASPERAKVYYYRSTCSVLAN